MFSAQFIDRNPKGLDIAYCCRGNLKRLENGSFFKEEDACVFGLKSLPANGSIEVPVLNKSSAKIYEIVFKDRTPKEVIRHNNGLGDWLLHSARKVTSNDGETSRALIDYAVKRVDDDNIKSKIQWC